MQERALRMSGKERDRLVVIRQVWEKKLGRREAGEQLGISERQVKRLLRRWRAEGDAGVVSRQRGKASHNRRPEVEQQKLQTLLREKYSDFGATLAAEKLAALDKVNVSRETVRQAQIGLGLHKPKRRTAQRVFQSRERRSRFGELIRRVDPNRRQPA